MKEQIDQIVLPATALDALGHGVCGYGADLVVTAWNGCLERLGVASHEAQGRALGELLRPLITDSDRRREVVEACRAALVDGECHAVPGVVMHFPAAPGSRFNVVATRAAHGADYSCLVLENVTETHRVRAQFERILNSTPDGIFVIDADRKIRLFNEACSFITGRATLRPVPSCVHATILPGLCEPSIRVCFQGAEPEPA